MLPRRYLPSMGALHALEALDRLGTASAAAAELALTQGAISRQIQSLEAQLSTPLVLREKGRLSLTPAARDYVVEVRKALKLLSDASIHLRANPSGGALNLAILPAFGLHWLAPRLARFAQEHSGVTVNLSTRLRPFDFTDSAMDAAIHYGREDWPGVSFLKLMDERLVAVCAPALLPKSAGDAAALLDLPLLQIDGRLGDWGRFFAHHGVEAPRPRAMLFDQFAAMTQAAIHGMGVALLPTFLVEAELASGRLVVAYGEPVAAAGAYYLVAPKDRLARAPLAAFQDWLRREIAEGPAA